jgi:UDP-N-acetylmuramate dehydrogenase
MNDVAMLREAEELLSGYAKPNEPLAPKTTYRVGGPAALYVEIDSREALERVATTAAATGIDVLVVGNGSNLLVADTGFHGLVVHLSGEFARLDLDERGGRVGAGAAVPYPVLARQSAASGLGGLEWAVGIPGTVGGAVTMNAGGHGSSTEMNLVDVVVVDLVTGEQVTMTVADLECSYRHTKIDKSHLVVSASFRTEPFNDREESLAIIEEIVRWRREHQPGGRNCGSVFTNPVGDSAGRLIEVAGCKGMRVGTAVVSTKHANFIQVDARGSASDVRSLIDVVKTRVFEFAGVELSAELRMAGFAS